MSSFTKFGRYRLLGRIATGGMAEIWAAQLVGAGGFTKTVAIKRVRPQLAQDPQLLRMLLTEARLGAKFSHSNLCTVFELGEVAGDYYIAMEYLRGGSLVHLLCGDVPVPVPVPVAVAAAIAAQACRGLHHAHEQCSVGRAPLGIVHRDVSPHSLFVTVDGIVKVLDFGIAKTDDGTSEPTESGKIKGKLGYMSPEQLAGGPIDRASDVWSLGVILWELVTGRRLFGGASGDTVDAIRSGRVPSLASMGISLPGVDGVIARAICQRELRYPTAAMLQHALLDVVPPAPLEAIAELVWERCADRVRRQDRWFDRAGHRDIIARLPLRASPPPGATASERAEDSTSRIALLADLERRRSLASFPSTRPAEATYRTRRAASLPDGTRAARHTDIALDEPAGAESCRVAGEEVRRAHAPVERLVPGGPRRPGSEPRLDRGRR